MNISLNRESSVPIRAQMALQIEIAVVTGLLKPGSKLPSVRELARRLKLHHNTVSAAYGDLTEHGLIESRRGSGIYVSDRGRPSAPEKAEGINDLIASFLEIARARGFSASEIRSAVEVWLRRPPPDHVLVVEPAPDIRSLLAHELSSSLPCRVDAVGPEALADPSVADAALVVASFYHGGDIRAAIGPGTPFITISFNSGANDIERLRTVPDGAIIGIVSVSPILLTMVNLFVTGVRGEEILVRPVLLSDEESWRRLARTADGIVCDSLSYEAISRFVTKPTRMIRLIPEETIRELRKRLGLAPAPEAAPPARPAARGR